ncbi:asparaginase [Pseudonocardia oroxyli]|uniref:Glutamyl-tRNA(Gln) amidotransferase subunit D n=1 Tax=Pseudonocardia oroxyli TaxID=366584 RepID=A0A1G7SRB3_PSEOR|nr:asparaginase [Pseudonocardia oroxyli]SDG24810.1 glutamyl-tRNA(Gln) amidotransferase subunit D [Pseudonocardia oroxyli]
MSVLTTGGTIAQQTARTTASGALGVAVPGFDVTRLLPGDRLDVALSVRSVSAKGSKDMRATDWLAMAAAVVEEIAAGADGVVLVHGTDTMHYTAAALSFVLGPVPVPVVLTGSMRPGGDPDSDGAANLRDAVRTAATADLGEVVVVFSGDADRRGPATILRGNRARKVHSTALNAFASPALAPLGAVGESVVLSAHARPKGGSPPRPSPAFAEDVALVTVTPTTTAPLLAGWLAPLSGVVLAGTGTGHVHADLVPVLADLGARGGAVVMSSQAAAGGERLGAYSGDLTPEVVPGLVGAGAMTAEAALVKLMWVLGRGADPEQVGVDRAGELAERW